MIVTQRYDLEGHVSGYTVTDAQPIEHFSRELLDNADGVVLTWNDETRIATITADNGVWRYRVFAANDSEKILTGQRQGIR